MKPTRATLEAAEIGALKIAKTITPMLPHGWHFTLILASAGEDGFMTYVADIERPSAREMLRELLTKWDRDEPEV